MVNMLYLWWAWSIYGEYAPFMINMLNMWWACPIHDEHALSTGSEIVDNFFHVSWCTLSCIEHDHLRFPSFFGLLESSQSPSSCSIFFPWLSGFYRVVNVELHPIESWELGEENGVGDWEDFRGQRNDRKQRQSCITHDSVHIRAK